MARKIYMNVAEGDECRIAVMEDGKLYEFFIDRPSQLKHVGNIYKGVINNVEPGIQAAFVDIGPEGNGFLHVSDVSYAYQNNTDIRELFDRKLRIKEPLPEDTLLNEAEERDVEEVEDYVGAEEHPTEASSGAVEAEFLEKLDEEHPGHQVTDSPLDVPPAEKETPQAGTETPGEPTQTTGTKKRRRRGRRRKKNGAQSENRSPDRKGGEDAAAAKQPTAPKQSNDADQKPTTQPEAKKEAEAKPQPTETKPGTETSQEAETKMPAKRRRRRTPKLRGGRLPKRVTDEVEKKADNPEPTDLNAERKRAPSQDQPASSETTEPKTKAPTAEPPKPAPEAKQVANRKEEQAPAEDATPAKEKAKPDAGSDKPESAGPNNDTPNGDNGPGRHSPQGDGGPIPGPLYRYHRGPQPKVQNLLKRGQEVVIQVTKASQGGKGPGLSTFVSLPGRYMVLTPNSDRGGVSRKIEDGAARNELRKMLDKLPVPEGMGVIVRTAAINRSFEDLSRDLNYLLRVWTVISERIHEAQAPALLYTDSDPAIRTVRDYFTADTTEIIVDDREVFERVLAFFDQLMPSFRDRVKLYEGEVPLFFQTGLENQLDHLFDKKVNLKSGGYLFVEQTEALISIDVNSGKFTSAGDAEKTAYQTNMEAIPEICRQLRLRDLGGIVCCDLIDMSSARHRSDVEHALRRELRRDRARTKVAKMSPFGVIELTRQRVRPSIKNYTYVNCPTCAGFGMVRSAETMCLSLIRRMKLALIEDRVHELAVQVHPHVLSHLHSEFRDDIDDLEEGSGKRIVFEYAKDLALGQSRFFYVNDRGGRVLYDMDQRINGFLQGNAPKAKSNVPVPQGASGAASPAVAEARKEGKSLRRRRGGRRQREREQERQQREARIKADAEKAVTFGDKLPEVKVELVKEEPKKEGRSRRRGRRGGRKVREREAAKGVTADAPKQETKSPSGRKAASKSAGKAKATARSSTKKAAEPKKAEAKKTETKKDAPARKKTATKAATKSATRKTPAKIAAKKTPAKAAAKKPAAPKTTSGKKAATTEKAATKKPATKKAPAKKAATKKPATKKASKSPGRKAGVSPKATTKKATKATTKKPATKKPASTAKKKPAAKTPAKKAATKKTPVKKSSAKKK